MHKTVKRRGGKRRRTGRRESAEMGWVEELESREQMERFCTCGLCCAEGKGSTVWPSF